MILVLNEFELTKVLRKAGIIDEELEVVSYFKLSRKKFERGIQIYIQRVENYTRKKKKS